jgi:hypothetical protein
MGTRMERVSTMVFEGVANIDLGDVSTFLLMAWGSIGLRGVRPTKV